jgi:hypothetical protein
MQMQVQMQMQMQMQMIIPWLDWQLGAYWELGGGDGS